MKSSNLHWFYLKHTYRFTNKIFFVNKRLRIFTAGGNPDFRWIPNISYGYYKYWGWSEINVCWLGIELFISIGKDFKGFYKELYNKS